VTAMKIKVKPKLTYSTDFSTELPNPDGITSTESLLCTTVTGKPIPTEDYLALAKLTKGAESGAEVLEIAQQFFTHRKKDYIWGKHYDK